MHNTVWTVEIEPFQIQKQSENSYMPPTLKQEQPLSIKKNSLQVCSSFMQFAAHKYVKRVGNKPF